MKRFLLILLAALAVFSLLGCQPDTPPAEATAVPTTEAPTEPPLDPAALYSEAVAALEAREAISLQIRRAKEMDIAGAVFQETWEQTQSRHEDTLQVSTTISQGTDVLSTEEFWRRDKAYLVLDGQGFCQEMPREDFLARQVPVGMLNIENYGSITAQTVSEGTLLTFREASAPESWLAPVQAQLRSAEGTATISPDGTLAASSYTLTYGYGGVTVTLTCSFTVGEDSAEPVLPEDAKSFPTVQSIDAPRLMLQAWSLLRSSPRIQITAMELGFENATSTISNRSIVIHGDSANVITQDVAPDGSAAVCEETVLDGVYTRSEEDEAPVTETLTPQDAARKARDFLELGYPGIADVGDASCTDLEGYLLLEFTLSSNRAQAMLDEAAGMDTANLLMKAAQGDFYVVVDPYTGLPTAWSQTFQGYFSQNQENFVAGSQITAAIDGASLSAPTVITGEDPEPLDAPMAPPFYRVSNDQGSTVWLLCEAPPCDSRIYNVPQAILDALAQSDALTVVANESELDTDSAQMAQQMDELLLYTDGTTIRDHLLDSKIYKKAKAMMRAAGVYNDMMEFAKPTVWSAALENFYLRQGYSLSNTYSLSDILCEEAQNRDIPLRLLATMDTMIRLLSELPEYLQEFELSDTLKDSTMTRLLEAEALYALWCAGDTEGLLAHYGPDPDMNMEEVVLQRDYHQAMLQQIQDDCLAQMLDALSKGETVFFVIGPRYLYKEEGLLNALKDAGCTVEQIPFA